MEIISHRGYWIGIEEKNTIKAFERSFFLGYGTETDLRDFNRQIVISHDMPNKTSLSADYFFNIYKKAFSNASRNKTLALNVKSNGLQIPILNLLKDFGIEDYFLFDMSVPDLKLCIENGLNSFLRLSEYEKDLPFYNSIKGIWLDSFHDIWYDVDLILSHLNNYKKVCIVSSELHKRDYKKQWNFLAINNIHKFDNVILCTDLPEMATQFFYNEKHN